MDKLKMDEFIARLDVDLEIKFLLEQGLKKAHGNWFTFLHELEMVMVENEDFENAIQQLINNPEVRMINRNRGSGTRILLDRLLADQRPAGFFQEAKSHNSVAAAISQNRADWGIAIRSVAEDLGLGFYPIQDEEYDFIIPNKRLNRPEVRQFINLLQEANIQSQLNKLGLSTDVPV